MTDTELNEQIARLRGWRDPSLNYWCHPGLGDGIVLPDYLDPKLLPELMDLADRVLKEWTLENTIDDVTDNTRGHFASKIEHLVRKQADVVYHHGDTRSKAVALAIVGYAEGKLRTKVTQAIVDVTNEPLPPPIRHGHTPWSNHEA